MFPFALTKRRYILSNRKRLGESRGQQGEGSGPHLFLLLPFLYLIQFHAPLLEKSVRYFLWCQYFFFIRCAFGWKSVFGHSPPPLFPSSLGELGGDNSLQNGQILHNLWSQIIKDEELVADYTLMNLILPCNFCHRALPASAYVSVPID